MFSKKKFVVVMLCAILSCGLFCSSFLMSSAEAKPIIGELDTNVPDDFDDPILDGDTTDGESPSTPSTDKTDGDKESSDGEGSSTTDPYFTTAKIYKNGYQAYNGAWKYLQKLDSYQINSSGYLICTILGQALDGAINFKTVRKNDYFYNLFSINTSLFNVNIQARNNDRYVTYRFNQAKSYLDDYNPWVRKDFSNAFELFNRYILAGNVDETTAKISGFRKSATGYKFTMSLSESPLLENISSMVKAMSGVDVGLSFKSASIEFTLNKYGAPIVAKYDYAGSATYSGVSAPASVTLIEKYGNFNKNITVDTDLFGVAPF